MQVSLPNAQESPRSSDTTNYPRFREGRTGEANDGLGGDNDGFARTNHAETGSNVDRKAAERLEESDGNGDEPSFAQLLLDDTVTEPTVDFQQSPETPIVADQLPADLQTELPSNFSNVLSPSDGEVREEIGDTSRQNLLHPPVARSGLPPLPSTQQVNTAALTDSVDSLTESVQSQLTPPEAEPNSAANLTDTASFDRPSFVTTSTPQLEPPTPPAVPATNQAVTESVVDTIVETANLTEVGESKQLTLQLHPAELGQVTLLIDWEVDSLKVKIVASELAANEILNQNKSELIAALAEEGIDFDSLDVSYGNAQPDPEDDENSRSQQLAPDFFASPAEPENTETTNPNSNRSSNLDITV